MSDSQKTETINLQKELKKKFDELFGGGDNSSSSDKVGKTDSETEGLSKIC